VPGWTHCRLAHLYLSRRQLLIEPCTVAQSHFQMRWLGADRDRRQRHRSIKAGGNAHLAGCVCNHPRLSSTLFSSRSAGPASGKLAPAATHLRRSGTGAVSGFSSPGTRAYGRTPCSQLTPTHILRGFCSGGIFALKKPEREPVDVVLMDRPPVDRAPLDMRLAWEDMHLDRHALLAKRAICLRTEADLVVGQLRLICCLRPHGRRRHARRRGIVEC
jgi:hypothetical protein